MEDKNSAELVLSMRGTLLALTKIVQHKGLSANAQRDVDWIKYGLQSILDCAKIIDVFKEIQEDETRPASSAFRHFEKCATCGRFFAAPRTMQPTLQLCAECNDE